MKRCLPIYSPKIVRPVNYICALNQFPLLVSVTLYDGEQLNLTRITRSEMGAYLCIATNGVPPTVSKRITVDVECELVTDIPRVIAAFANE